MDILILGIGQPLRGDDAVGLEVVRLWKEKYSQSLKSVRVEVSELPGMELLDLLEGAHSAIMVDAIRSTAPPGTLVRLGSDDLHAFTADKKSAHGWGLAETLRLGYFLYPAMARINLTLIGVVGVVFSLGAGFSPQVLASLDPAVELIAGEVSRLL
jgi:hydrogenase maturation protease